MAHAPPPLLRPLHHSDSLYVPSLSVLVLDRALLHPQWLLSISNLHFVIDNAKGWAVYAIGCADVGCGSGVTGALCGGERVGSECKGIGGEEEGVEVRHVCEWGSERTVRRSKVHFSGRGWDRYYRACVR